MIHWEGLLASLATWEDPARLQQQFPATPPWGQGGTQGGVNVTTDMATPQPLQGADEMGPQARENVEEKGSSALTCGPEMAG